MKEKKQEIIKIPMKLDETRAKYGLTLSDLAKELNVSRPTLLKMEKEGEIPKHFYISFSEKLPNLFPKLLETE